MPGYFVKPSAPRRLASRPAGCALLMPLVEGSGGPRDFSGNGYHGTIVGAPAWSSGPYGQQLGPFSTSNFAKVSPTTQILCATYPCWIAALGINGGTGLGIACGQGSTTSGTPFAVLFWAAGNTLNNASYNLRDDAAATATASSTATTIADGLPHLLMGVSRTASKHELYVDGVLRATSTSTLGAMTCDRVHLGGYPAGSSTTNGTPFAGTLQWAAFGYGAVPDPWALYLDPFASLRELSSSDAIRAAAGSLHFAGPADAARLRPSRNRSLLRR